MDLQNAQKNLIYYTILEIFFDIIFSNVIQEDGELEEGSVDYSLGISDDDLFTMALKDYKLDHLDEENQRVLQLQNLFEKCLIDLIDIGILESRSVFNLNPEDEITYVNFLSNVEFAMFALTQSFNQRKFQFIERYDGEINDFVFRLHIKENHSSEHCGCKDCENFKKAVIS
jgi:hypothetical protein